MPSGRPPAASTASSTNGSAASRQQLSDTLELAFVAADAGRRDARVLDRETDDGLGVLVEDRDGPAPHRTRATGVSARISITSARRSRNGSGRSAVNSRARGGRFRRGELLAGLAIEQRRAGPPRGAASRRPRAGGRRTCRRTSRRPVAGRPSRRNPAEQRADVRACGSRCSIDRRRNVYFLGPTAGSSAPDLLIGRPRRPTMRGQRGCVSPGTRAVHRSRIRRASVAWSPGRAPVENTT